MLTFAAAAAAKAMLLTSFPFIPCSPESVMFLTETNNSNGV